MHTHKVEIKDNFVNTPIELLESMLYRFNKNCQIGLKIK